MVELFTSEGCSSCPPADALLARVVEDAARAGRRVYCLSLHVDYWDHLGWKDRFSSAAFTRRQRDYGERFELAGIYTPQIVVNGTDQFVGSDAAALERAVTAALSQPEAADPALTAAAHGREITVHGRIAAAPPGAVLHVAWVDARERSAPDAGENDGRSLEHVNVVRDLRDLPLHGRFDGDVHLRRPAIADGAVIAWVQDGGTGKVLGARGVPVAAR